MHVAHQQLHHEVADLAASQAGIVSTAQLLAIGMSPQTIQRERSAGRLIDAGRGVYGVGHLPATDEARWSAAVLRLGEDAALSHLSGARLLGLLRWRPRRVDVTAPRWHRPVAGVHRHAMQLSEREVTVVAGIRVTEPSRTIADCAQLLDEQQVGALMREAAHRGMLDPGALAEYCVPRRRRHGAPVLRSALELHAASGAGRRSVLERQVRDVLTARGAASPEENVPVSTDIGPVEVDLAWRDPRVVVEVDGPTHDLPVQRAADERSRAALRRAGWTVVVVHWRSFGADPYQATNPAVTALGGRTAPTFPSHGEPKVGFVEWAAAPFLR